MKRSTYFIFIATFILLISSACSSKKYLTQNEKFYTGASIEIIQKKKDSGEKSSAKSIAEQQLSPKPNDVFLKMRPAVWFYMRVDTSKTKKLGKWLKKKVGKEPVFYSDKIAKQTQSVIENKLFNKGFFNASVTYTVQSKNKETFINYLVSLGSRYQFDSVFVAHSTDSIFDHIIHYDKNSLLQKGNPYDLDVLKAERVRLTKEVRDKGYYFFESDLIGFKIDTTLGYKKLIAGIGMKESISPKSKTVYSIGSICVYPNYELEIDSTADTNSRFVGGVKYVNTKGSLDYEFLNESIFFKKGDTYSVKNHDLTIKRLYALNIFKFIDVRFVESDSIDNILDVVIYLTQSLPQSVQFELGVSSKSNNFVGPGVDLTYRHKNLFKHAEQFSIGIGGAFESQIGKNTQGVNSTEFSVESSLSIPKLWFPIHLPTSRLGVLPKTELGFQYKLLNRTLFYRLNSTSVDFGYRWNENEKRQHKLSLIDLNYTRATEISETFNQFLNQNPELRTTFKEQFVFSSSYNLWYYSTVPNSEKSYWYINPGIELAGNIINITNQLLTPNQTEQRKILGVAYSQFSKFDLDIRYFLPLGNENKIACRFIGGIGYAYGNSNQLPYLKQYFSGGSTSIRAFQARSVGPGVFRSAHQNGLLIDQSGDIKLETNIEYRAKLYSFIKGALFIDAGNIWLLHENEQTSGGQFYFDKFMSQIVIGTGAGIRFDFTYFVLRTDLAFPLKKPIEGANAWVIDQIDFSKNWRQNNLVLNIAIGYPF